VRTLRNPARLDTPHRVMRDNGRIHFEPGTGWAEVDNATPATALMAAEAAAGLVDDDDDAAPEIDADRLADVPPDALKILVRFLIPSNSVSEKKRWRMMTLRTALLAHMLDIDGIGKKSFEELGQELGCTRALLSLYSLRMIDGLGIDKCRNGKSRSSRQVFRKSATEAHRRARHRMTADKPAEDAL
jgi:hypothetical protein